ncbi:MAG: membrane protein insertase YidC [Deltaproteobacteria bacterium]|nr:membrane protein insertase YidC [Deltaproteobacteria bacterium]
MEQGRFIIAIVLSILVFIVWEQIFVGRKPIEQPVQKEETQQSAKEAVPTKEIIVKEPAAEPVPIPVDSALHKKAKTITVDTPLFKVKISENGAVFKSFILKNYKETIDAGSPLLEIISPTVRNGTVGLRLADDSIPGLDKAVFSSNIDGDDVDVSQKSRDVIFSWTSPQGVVVEKKFLFSPETYLIGLNVTIKNHSQTALRDNLILSLQRPAPSGKSRYGFEGPSAFINNKLEQIKIKKIKKKDVYTGELTWIAVQDRYFMSAIIPEKPQDASMHLSLSSNDMLKSAYMQPVSVFKPGAQDVFEYKLFFGPKSMKILTALDYDLVKAINFGMFDVLAKPCVWIMNFLYDNLIPNYGIAIIILTIFTKVILWPLGTKSYKSMNEMKKIQPLMTEIREKYKDDKKKMNEETMALYKAYKVNPVGGCLPMVVQIPVFFALYRMLYEAIELRHAPFLGWINDLSAPDRLLRFDFTIPLMQAPYGIPVLTIIMGATMFIQQKMSPAVGDPAQAKMMKFMPIAFTFIFINFSSGLVLYWLVNNILSIAQQYYITRKTA